MKSFLLLCVALTGFSAAHAQAPSGYSLNPQAIGKTPIDSWTTFDGDYTGQRYSTLTEMP